MLKRFLPLIFTLVFYLGCLALAMRLDLDNRVTTMLPDSDPEVADFGTFLTQVPAAEFLYLQVSLPDSESGPDPDLLAKAGDALYAAIKPSPYFTDILYQFSQEGVIGLLDLVHDKKFSILSPGDLEQAWDRIDSTDTDRLVLDIKRRLISPSGSFSARTLAGDPFGLDTLVLKKLAVFQAEMPGISPGESRILSRDGRHLLMVASPSFPAVDTVTSEKMMTDLNRIRSDLTRQFQNKITIGISGVHPATLDNAATIQSDIKRTILVITAGILVMGFLFFGRLYHVLLIFVPTLVSLAFAGAVAALAVGKVSGIALGCGALLVGITVDFGIHILFHADTLGTNRARSVIEDLRKPVLTGAATTMAAFGCLLFSDLPGQRQMGWISILGIAGAAGFALTVLRHLIVVRPWQPTRPKVSLMGAYATVTAFRERHRSLMVVLCILLVLAGAAGLKQFTFDGDLAALNHLSPEAQADMDRFLAVWGQSPRTLFMVTAPDLDRALGANDALARILDGMEKEGIIANTASLARILPSRTSQTQRRDRARALFTPERIRDLSHRLEAAGKRNGLAPGAFAPFIRNLDTLSQTRDLPPLVPEDFKSTVIWPLIQSKLIIKPDQVMMLTSARVTDKAMIPAVAAEIKKQLPGTLVIDKPWFIQKITALVAGEFKSFMIWAALAMVGVLALFQRRAKVVAATLIPVCLSAVITAGLLGLAGISVNLISIIFIIFVFGVGVDYAIFLVHHEMTAKKDERGITPCAVILCAMTTIGAFASLCFAQHKALFSIGVAGLTGMTVSLVLAMVIIPPLVKHWIQPGRGKF